MSLNAQSLQCTDLLSPVKTQTTEDSFALAFLYQNLRFPLTATGLNLDLSLHHLIHNRSKPYNLKRGDVTKAYEVMARAHQNQGVKRKVSKIELEDLFSGYLEQSPFVMLEALEYVGTHVYNADFLRVDESTVEVFANVPPGHEVLSVAKLIRKILRTPEVTKVSKAYKDELKKTDTESEADMFILRLRLQETLVDVIRPQLIKNFPKLAEEIGEPGYKITKAEYIIKLFAGTEVELKEDPFEVVDPEPL